MQGRPMPNQICLDPQSSYKPRISLQQPSPHQSPMICDLHYAFNNSVQFATLIHPLAILMCPPQPSPSTDPLQSSTTLYSCLQVSLTHCVCFVGLQA